MPACLQNNDRMTLTSRSISGALWGGAGMTMRIALQVFAQIALARILGPEQFGLFAVGMTIVMFSVFFVDVGFAIGLIQKKELTDDDVRFAFTVHLVLGIAVTAAVFLAAHPIAALMNDPRAAPVIQWLSLTCLLNSLMTPGTALLKRELRFKALNLAGVVSYAIGFVGIGLPMALAGAQVEALIAANVSATAINAAIVYACTRHPIGLLPWYPGARGLVGFGAAVFATNLSIWAMTSLDRLFFGRYMSMSAAGLYSTMYNFISVPASSALSAMQSVVYAASARVQDDKQRMGFALRTLIALSMLVIAPVFVSAAAVADTIVFGLYGHKWAGGGELLRPLALAMPALVMTGLATPILWAAGYITTELKLQVPITIVWVVALYLAATSGQLELAAWVMMVLYTIRGVVMVGATASALGEPARLLLSGMRSGAAVTVAVAGAVWAADAAARQLLGHPALWLAVDVAVGAVALPVALYGVRRWTPDGVRRLMSGLFDKLPQRFGAPLSRMFGV